MAKNWLSKCDLSARYKVIIESGGKRKVIGEYDGYNLAVARRQVSQGVSELTSQGIGGSVKLVSKGKALIDVKVKSNPC